ncbi:hypothetical protein [Microbacterium sp. XT11]|uniref:hypothetical protein n=1 Tax=Microbacterium sp. XT11 TaxID=367477 RepID=UPI00082B1FE5|nr:hypothetical protein [Microbacterium sp. XT11]
MSLSRTFHGMRAGLVSAAMRPGRISAPAPRAGIPRKTLTDKLGVPESATDADVLAALDAKLAAKKQSTGQTPARAQQSADDALYALAGWDTPAEAAPAARDADAALYAAAWGV